MSNATTTTATTRTTAPTKPMSPLLERTRSRIIEFYREPAALFWVFGFPLLLAIALGLAFRNKPPDAVKVVVVDGKDDVAGALHDGFDVKRAAADEARLMLRRGQVDLLVDESDGKVVYRFDETRPEGRYARLAVEREVEASH